MSAITSVTTEAEVGTLDLSCPACEGVGRGLGLVVDGRYRLIRCRSCRSEYFRPDPALLLGRPVAALSEYWEQYKFDLYADDAVRRGYEARYTDALADAERFAPVRSVLDIGCGIGNFVAFAQDRGLRAYGSDVDADAVAAARSRDLHVATSDDLDELLADGSVDAVTLWDVIEHLYQPEPVLAGALGKLRPGGLVILETPDAAFPVRPAVLAVEALTKGRVNLTPHLYYWEHKIYFTEAGLRSILGRLGCEVVSVTRVTSPRAKMSRIFDQYAERSFQSKVLARVWPALESLFRRTGNGNKLILVARLPESRAT